MSFAMSAAAATLAATTGLGTPAVSVAFTQGMFESPTKQSFAPLRAVTYDKAAVPEFSRMTIGQHTGPRGTRITLRLHGVRPHHTFGAHVHTKPCGAGPDASGPHYQHRADPAARPGKPSTDPAYANPHNEVWLDPATDRHGNAYTESAVGWRFRAGEARSVVLHAHKTHTGRGHAGDAGARLACMNVNFRR